MFWGTLHHHVEIRYLVVIFYFICEVEDNLSFTFKMLYKFSISSLGMKARLSSTYFTRSVGSNHAFSIALSNRSVITKSSSIPDTHPPMVNPSFCLKMWFLCVT